MNIVYDWPPNIEEIEKRDPLFKTRPNIITTYGDTIYNPHGSPIADYVMVHEEVHARQHAAYPGGAAAYTKRCLEEEDFFLMSEVEAYTAEYLELRNGLRYGFRNPSLVMQYVTEKLLNPAYGFHLSIEQAVALIRDGVSRSSPEKSSLHITKTGMSEEMKNAIAGLEAAVAEVKKVAEAEKEAGE